MLLRERGGRIKSEWTLRCPVTNTMPYPAIRARCNREIPRVQIEDLCEGCISLSIAEGLVSGVSAFFFLPVSGPYFIPVFLTFKVFFSLFTLPCSQTCEQTFVNKAQNIFKVNFYSKGNSSFSSTFMNPSGSFFGWIRFHER